MNTQTKLIYDIMIEDYQKGGRGLNSVFIRNTYYVVDVATRMFDNKDNFKAVGLKYDKRFEKNRTATYFLKRDDESVLPTYLKASRVTTEPHIEPVPLNPVTPQPWENLVRVEKNGRVYWEKPEDLEPKQGSLTI